MALFDIFPYRLPSDCTSVQEVFSCVKSYNFKFIGPEHLWRWASKYIKQSHLYSDGCLIYFCTVSLVTVPMFRKCS